ncbi:hypothetical protein [Bradyrhizobium liaoningense]|uniref:hypothetical protein n=1 Tax=Bradyrhizobium liaoningense TaxID=43992 RepID=UPI001BA6C45A|nr:hypothetical protein [Bradyrhizobium liaoningense]MBR0822402.1 hypothetical protein [Bradyrhizobium liaoningense]
MWSDEARALKLKHDVELYLRGRMPEATDLKQAPLIDEWLVHIDDRSAGIVGLVEEKRHRTTRLIWLDRNYKWARTEDALYCLATPTNKFPEDTRDLLDDL